MSDAEKYAEALGEASVKTKIEPEVLETLRLLAEDGGGLW